MKVISATSGASAESTATACGPCSATKRAIIKPLETHIRRKTRRHMGIVAFLGAGIDHQEEASVMGGIAGAHHHQIVDDAAFLGEELGIALLAGLEIEHVGGDECLQRLRRRRVIGADEPGLAHMRHVEQTRLLAGPLMLFQDAEGILHRHVVAGERHHARAGGKVPGVERRLQKALRRISAMASSSDSVSRGKRRRLPPTSHAPPLSRNLRDFLKPLEKRFRKCRVTPFGGQACLDLPLSRVPAPRGPFA